MRQHKRLRRILSMVGVALFGTLGAVHAADRVRVGLSSTSATLSRLWVAREKGLFSKYGIDAELISLGGGSNRTISALIAGDIQFSIGGGDGSVRAHMKGADVVILASTLSKGLQRLLARPEIKTAQDLKGKKVGITRFGSASQIALQLVLKKWGWRLEDVQMVQLGSSPAMLASLDKGGVDAAMLDMPTFFLAEEKGYRLLAEPGEMDIVYLQSTLESSRAYTKANRDQALRFMKGYVEGIAFFKKNKVETIEIMRKKLRIQSEQERDSRYLEMSYNLLASKYYNEVPYPSVRGVQTILDFVAQDDPKAKGLDPKSFADDSFVREIEASGLIKTLYGK